MRSLLLSVSLLVATAVLGGCSSDPTEDLGDTTSKEVKSGSGNAQVTASALHIRSAPNSTSSSIGILSQGARVTVSCKVSGESVGGDSDWDYIPDQKGYVSDDYISKLGASFPECGQESSTTPAGNSNSTDATGLVANAQKWNGTHETGNNCNPFSSALGRPCEPWCADFVNYVWQQGGMNTNDVTSYAGSFLTYGQVNGTLKDPDSQDVQPGDAVVWARSATDAQHVGMVTEVLDNGDVRVINGNYSDQVEEVVQARSSTIEGYAIAGFVSPVSN